LRVATTDREEREKEKQGKRGAAPVAWRSRQRWLGAAQEMERRLALAVDWSGVRATAGGSERTWGDGEKEEFEV
jgi:hypothetical protein